jgi:hypothetical protein
MLCIHTDNSNKPNLIIDDLSASTSHASDSKSDSESDSIVIKPVIVDTTYLENSCLNNHVMPKSNESGTQGKFVPSCNNCGKICHILPNCYLLKSHRPNYFSSKYVTSHKKHRKGKGNIICENASLKFADRGGYQVSRCRKPLHRLPTEIVGYIRELPDSISRRKFFDIFR